MLRVVHSNRGVLLLASLVVIAGCTPPLTVAVENHDETPYPLRAWLAVRSPLS